MDDAWTWADLNSRQAELLSESEQALGADYLLAYQAPPADAGAPVGTPPADLKAARLSESELECLQGLEAQLHAVVVAYSRNDS